MSGLPARVSAAFDPTDLKRICEQEDFSAYATRYPLKERSLGGSRYRNRFYYHKDNGSQILAVAHLDHIWPNAGCHVIHTAGGLLALSGALDDRLGVYVILELLPKLDIGCDWLLTTDEEVGLTTAADFRTDKQYNWMISFDRGGRDVVMYQYDTPELRQRVMSAGGTPGEGSFGDISSLSHLNCAGLNWGVGFYEYHGPRSHAWLNDTFALVAQFVRFYRMNARREWRMNTKPMSPSRTAVAAATAVRRRLRRGALTSAAEADVARMLAPSRLRR
ncbi:MAG TPA: hypothetical protein VNU19_09945 [Candidatus Acidoferrum sp.]|nr:hypothetical protein [Candidatus Acidoferrum sp.]